MKILIVNPNSSQEMTTSIRQEMERIRRADTKVTVVRVGEAPPSISSVSDEVLAAPGVVRHVHRAAAEGCDAAIIACFSDPGLAASREAAGIPVLGIQETTLHVVASLGRKFTVLTPLAHRVSNRVRDVELLGLTRFLASVRALELSVAETDGDPRRTKERIVQVSRRAIAEDGAEAIVLGCAGMVGYSEELEGKLGIPVLDPTTVTFKVCEGLGEVGLRSFRSGSTRPFGEHQAA